MLCDWPAPCRSSMVSSVQLAARGVLGTERDPHQPPSVGSLRA